jgi:hypothetical protein
LLNLAELVDSRVKVSEEQRNFEFTFVWPKVRIDERERAPSNYIITVDLLTFQKNQLEHKDVSSVRFSGDHNGHDLIKVAIFIVVTTIETNVSTVSLVEVQQDICVFINFCIYSFTSRIYLVSI